MDIRKSGDRRFDNRRELVRRSDTPGGVQLPISNWGRISAELKFARRCPAPRLDRLGHSLTPPRCSSLIKPIKLAIQKMRSSPFYRARKTPRSSSSANGATALRNSPSSSLITDLVTGTRTILYGQRAEVCKRHVL